MNTNDEFRFTSQPYQYPQARIRITANYPGTAGRAPESIDIEINDPDVYHQLPDIIDRLAFLPAANPAGLSTGAGDGPDGDALTSQNLYISDAPTVQMDRVTR